LELPRIGLSMIDDRPSEIVYLSLHHLSARVQDALSQQTVELALGKMQIDNQMKGSLFPVVFAPSPVAPEDVKPMLQLSVNKSKLSEEEGGGKGGIMEFQYASLLLQKVDIKVEEALIYVLLGYFNDFYASLGHRKDEAVIQTIAVSRLSEQLAIPESQQERIFFHFLQIQPLAFNVWFSASAMRRGERKAQSANFDINPFQMVLGALVGTIGNIDGAPIRLNGKIIENASGSKEAVIGSLVQFYTQQGIAEAYKILGSFEFLGNPIGLVGNLGSGVYDFFYEPAKGLVSSPQDFGRGLAKGSLSLLRSTLSGVFGAVSKITSSVGKGVAAVTMDDEFIAKQQRRNQKAPEHIGQGLVGGVKSLGSGIARGVTGIVVDPLKGAKEEGASGFVKGVGKGLIGIVAKPTAGVMGFATQALQGIGNTASYLTEHKVANAPVRPQRYIPPSRHLRVYDLEEAKTHRVHPAPLSVPQESKQDAASPSHQDFNRPSQAFQRPAAVTTSAPISHATTPQALGDNTNLKPVPVSPYSARSDVSGDEKEPVTPLPSPTANITYP